MERKESPSDNHDGSLNLETESQQIAQQINHDLQAIAMTAPQLIREIDTLLALLPPTE